MAQKSLLRPQKATQTVFVARLKIAVTVETKTKSPFITKNRYWIPANITKTEVNESDPRSNLHYLGSSENKAWKKFIPVNIWLSYILNHL